MSEQITTDAITLPPYPICERRSLDKHEVLYKLNYRRFVLVCGGDRIVMSRDDVSSWLAEHNMSRVVLS